MNLLQVRYSLVLLLLIHTPTWLLYSFLDFLVLGNMLYSRKLAIDCTPNYELKLCYCVIIVI